MTHPYRTPARPRFDDDWQIYEPESGGPLYALLVFVLTVVLPIGVIAVALAMGGCGGAQSSRPWTTDAQAAIVVVAHAVDAADVIARDRYQHETAANGGHTTPEIDARYTPLVTARQTARESLLAAQAAIDTAIRIHDAPSNCAALHAVHGTTIALIHVLAAFDAGGIAEVQPLAEAAGALAVIETAGPQGCP